MAQFYVAAGNSKSGPFNVSDIKDGLLAGRLNENSLIWTQGMQGWKRLAETSLSKLLSQEAQPEIQVMPSSDFNIFNDRFWSVCSLVWLALLGMIFIFDALFIIKDNPLGGGRMLVLMPWMFFSLTASGFTLFATVTDNQKAKEIATATAATLLMTIWLCLLVSFFWSIVSDRNSRFSKVFSVDQEIMGVDGAVPGGVEGEVWTAFPAATMPAPEDNKEIKAQDWDEQAIEKEIQENDRKSRERQKAWEEVIRSGQALNILNMPRPGRLQDLVNIQELKPKQEKDVFQMGK